jgi:hypothetical protein
MDNYRDIIKLIIHVIFLDYIETMQDINFKLVKEIKLIEKEFNQYTESLESWGRSSMVECFSSKCETVVPVPSTRANIKES